MANFQGIFNPDNPNDNEKRRSKFLARVFGIFNEEIVRIWASWEQAEFKYLGRPTIYLGDKKHTLDFMFQKDNKYYVVEMKSWLEFENFGYFELIEKQQLDKVINYSEAFRVFLNAANGIIAKTDYHVQYKDEKQNPKKIDIEGFILIWGKVSLDSATQLQQETKIHRILSLEEITLQMRNAKYEPYLDLISQYQGWSNFLYNNLKT